MKLSYPYIVDHIPRDTPLNRRPGIPLNWEFITVHNTGNPESNALEERAWLVNPDNGGPENGDASFHIAVDDTRAVECIPLTEVAWHARGGNYRSIGVEICESGNYVQTMRNATELFSNLLLSKNKTTAHLRQHWDWSGKDCPRLIRRGHEGWTWDVLKRSVEKRMEVKKALSKYFKDVDQAWQAEHIDELKERGVISGRSATEFDPDAPITRAEAAVVVNKAINYVIKELSE